MSGVKEQKCVAEMIKFQIITILINSTIGVGVYINILMNFIFVFSSSIKVIIKYIPFLLNFGFVIFIIKIRMTITAERNWYMFIWYMVYVYNFPFSHPVFINYIVHRYIISKYFYSSSVPE